GGLSVIDFGHVFCMSNRSLTYEPGASSRGFSFPWAGSRACTFRSSRSVTQACQSVHQDPACWLAPDSHSSAVFARLLRVQYPYLLAVGGLMIPAMCPDPPSTKRTGPENSWVPR